MKSKIIIIILFILISIFSIYYINFRVYTERVLAIEKNMNYSKYVSLYYIMNDFDTIDMVDFLDFIKERDADLYKQLMRVHYRIHDNTFYVLGFDKQNDFGQSNYSPDDINFLESFFIKGDILISVELYFETDINTFYKVYNDSIYPLGDINIAEIYKKELSCDSINAGFLIPNPKLSYPEEIELFKYGNIPMYLELRKGDIQIKVNGFSERSTKILLDSISKMPIMKTKDTLVFISFMGLNIEDYKCVDD